MIARLAYWHRFIGALAGVALVIIGPAIIHAAQLSLSWSDASSNETGFHIERKTGTGGTYATLASVGAGTTGYVDGTVTAGTTYCYRVSAYNSAGDSPYSNEACAAAAAPTLYGVTVGKGGTGSGSVASSPSGINCGSVCSANFAGGTSVALSATPAVGSTLTGWSGACTGTGTCSLVVDSAKGATATFGLSSYALSVTKAGAGNGTVTSAPAGITCGATCTGTYTYNTVVTLTAAAAAGSTFTGWSGACTGTGSCTVTLDNAKSVTATFALQTYTLTLAKAGTGSGTVASSPAGITCGATCTGTYTYNAVVTLTAAPAAGSTFTGWGGACTGTGACTVTVDAAKSVTATFTLQTYALTVSKSGIGSGTITSTPAGINCGTTCSASFNSGTGVTLAAAAAGGSTFTGWGGACSGTGACTVTVDAAKSVTATFALQTYSLTVSTSGTGGGTVTSSPSGISCGSTCSASFNSGTSITLTATASSGSTFTGWGGACSGTGTCVVTMNAAQGVTASFAVTPPPNTYTLSVTRSGAGTGLVASNPGGINCGSACRAGFTSGTSVTLEALPDAGSTFVGWSGACGGAGSCTVAMSQAQNVTATFAVQTVTLTVSDTGTGSGTVVSNPAGIDCGTACSKAFIAGTIVSLGVTPSRNSTFAGWSGACSGTGDCKVTLTQVKSVTATFKKKGRK